MTISIRRTQTTSNSNAVLLLLLSDFGHKLYKIPNNVLLSISIFRWTRSGVAWRVCEVWCVRAQSCRYISLTNTHDYEKENGAEAKKNGKIRSNSMYSCVGESSNNNSRSKTSTIRFVRVNVFYLQRFILIEKPEKHSTGLKAKKNIFSNNHLWGFSVFAATLENGKRSFCCAWLWLGLVLRLTGSRMIHAPVAVCLHVIQALQPRRWVDSSAATPTTIGQCNDVSKSIAHRNCTALNDSDNVALGHVSYMIPSR